MVNTKELEKRGSLMWALIAVVLLLVALMPQLLLLPILGMVAFLAYKIYVNNGNVKAEDIKYHTGALLALILAYVWPRLILVALGFAIAKALEYK